VSRTLYYIALVLSLFSLLHGQNLTITHLDVGQGDATVIQVKGGPTVLIDAGLPGKGNDIVASWLSKAGVTRLDAVIASHYHADHIGGITEVIESLSPDSVLLVIDRGSTFPLPKSRALTAYRESVSRVAHHATAHPGLNVRLSDNVSLTCIAADGAVTTKGTVARVRQNENDLSLAWVLTATLSIAERSYVFRYFTGGDCGGSDGSHVDLETPMSTRIGRVDAFKVNHHGSKYSTNTTFLKELRPRVAVISVGDANQYGHPAQEMLERLQSCKSVQVVYQTQKGSSPSPSKVKVIGSVTIAVYDSFFVAQQDTFRLGCENSPTPELPLVEQIVRSVDCQRIDSVRMLSFEVLKPMMISVSVYNLLGALVTNFARKRYAAGTHLLSFDKLDLPPGLYFVSFTSGKQRTVRRVVLKP
jgi:ribonuclease BN (tRNA processing enzyme)